MYYISTDIGKFNHCASVINSDSEVLLKPFFFKNNKQGFLAFYSNTKYYICSKHIAGLEATGHYGDNFIYFLLDKNYQTDIINPISTDA